MGNCLVPQGSQINRTENLDARQTGPCTISTSMHTLGASAQMVIEENMVGVESVRIKLVVKKNQLKDILKKDLVSIDDMMFLLNKERSKRCKNDKERQEWRPVLESIPEESHFFLQNLPQLYNNERVCSYMH